MAGLFYVNVNLASTSGDPAPLAKTITFPTPLIKNQSDYVCAVSRLVLPLNGIPMWIPTLQYGGDGYDTIYKITLTQGAASSGPVALRLVQQVPTIPPPAVPLTDQPENEWAFIYDLAQVASMMTTAANEALTRLATAGGAVPIGAAIRFEWNPTTSLFTASMTPYSAWEGSSVDAIKLFFSATFAPYTAGWQVTEFNLKQTRSEANGYRDVQLVTLNTGMNWLDAPAGGSGAWQQPPGAQATPFVPRDASTAMLVISQHWSAPWVFNALATVQLAVNGITNTPEYVEPSAADQSKDLVSLSASNVATILTDFAPDLSGAGFFEQTIVYNASSQIPGMRFIELGSGGSVSFLSVAAYWTDQRGRQRVLVSARESQSATVKLCFAPRSLAGFS